MSRFKFFIWPTGDYGLRDPDDKSGKWWLLTAVIDGHHHFGYRIHPAADGTLPAANMTGVPEEELLAADAVHIVSRHARLNGSPDMWIGYRIHGEDGCTPQNTEQWAGWLAAHMKEQ